MDKFDLQIAMQKPTDKPARLDERHFMKKLAAARRAQQARRVLIAVMMVAAAGVVAGALRRDLFDLVSLTFKYLGDTPHMANEYASAYAATISWPGLLAMALLGGLAAWLLRTRRELPAAPGKQLFRLTAGTAVLALALGVVGLLGSPAHADAQHEALKRKLNERGHLEVQVNGKDYELYDKSNASDASIRSQALIAEIRVFDIATAYPELREMRSDGFIAEIRDANADDDCIFYNERRLEPALDKVYDANSGCIRGDYPVYYLNHNLKPTKAPTWKKGQAVYMSSAKRANSKSNQPGAFVGIIVLLDGKADDYVARSNSETLVPKGQPGTGSNTCGINLEDMCPTVGYVDVFMNGENYIPSGEIGSAVTDDTLRPRAGTEMVEVFGKITALDSRRLEIVTSSGRQVAVAWPHNFIEDFNVKSGDNYQTVDGPLRIALGDHLFIRFYYSEGMDTTKLALSDVQVMNVAIKTTLPDPLANEKYSKEKASLIEKY